MSAGSTGEVLNLRQLNRTTLARQLLLQRARLPATSVVERLVGAQAQLARAPYVGVWSRLEGFRRADLAAEIAARRIVKATFLRGTLHLLATRDYLDFRSTLQAVLTSGLEDVLKSRGASVDVPRLVEAAREFMRAQPRSFAEITTLLTALVPDGDPGAMRYAVRTHLPMVQVPIDKHWSYPGNPRFALAEDWIEAPLPTHDRAAELLKRYLRAFGPATVADMQTWSYLANLQPVFERLRAQLRCYRDERGRELFDLADGTIEPDDGPAAVRFLPEFDNLLLGHQDRTRVMPKAYRSQVYLPGLRVAATVLVDGFVAATWTTQCAKQAATLVVAACKRLSKDEAIGVLEEGEQLVRFAEPEATTFSVRIVEQ